MSLRLFQQKPAVAVAALGDSDKPPVPDTELPEKAASTPSLMEVPADAAHGVRQVEAITLTWTKPHLIVAYICMFLLYFTNAFQSSITYNLSAYVVSGFDLHSLIPVIAIVSNVMTGAAYLPVAKLLDLWGRPGGFALMASISTLGLILTAVCTNIETYCAAQVFYSIGFSGMIYSIDVITADTSTMRDRGLAFAFTSSPYMITAFAGPKAAELFYADNWRWAYGCWAIVLPVVATPLFYVLYSNQAKAKRSGLLVRTPSGRTWVQSVAHYAVEFDLIGVVLLAAGLVLFLLPFSIAEAADDKWRSAHIIAMLVLGLVCLFAFVLVERYVSPKPFVPYHLLLSRNVLGACLLDATYQIAYYCWNSYFSSYLQVVYGLTLSQAGYIGGIFDVVSGVWLLVVGVLMRLTGRYKWLLLVSVPLYILFVGLLIHFRRPGTPIGLVVMCEIFIAFAGGTMIIGQQIAVMASAAHGDVAAVLAILGLFGYMGGAVGNSISGAVWTHTLPGALRRLLPEDAKADWETIYDDLEVQLSYAVGSATRSAIMDAYAETQSRMLVAGTAIMALALVWVLMLKDIRLTDVKQVKGLLF